VLQGHARARAAVNQGDLLQAAKVLCDEFGALLNMEPFWRNVQDAATTGEEHTAAAVSLLREITSFIEAERDVFKGLGIPEDKWGPIIKDAFSGRSRSEDAVPLSSAQTVIELNAFRRDLEEARSLVCDELEKSRGRFASEWIVSETGVRVLADAAAMGVNASLIALPPLPLASIFAAVRAARKDVPDIIAFVKSWRRRR
jgi:hypothetical protein